MKGQITHESKYKKEIMKEELRRLDSLEKQVTQYLINVPKGRIRAEMSKGKYPQYYYVSEVNTKKREHSNNSNENNCNDISTDKIKKRNARYLRKDELELARACVQREYDNLVLREITKRKRELHRLLSSKPKARVEEAYNKLSTSKKCLVTPYVMPDEEFLEKWIEREDITNSVPMTNCFITERGEKVRSKSEKMIADKLFLNNVNYKYEAGLTFKNNMIIFPDFTLLKLDTREDVYYEHFGMMDNPEYCKKALEKIDVYSENGIYLGERLFVTFESSIKPINLKRVDEIIELVNG